MKNKLTCEQVMALLGFYFEDKLNSKLKSLIDYHLKNCSACQKLYSVRTTKSDSANNIYVYDSDLAEALSAYIDNELDDNESVRMRKIAITNPIARKKLEGMYTIKKEMHNYFNKIKSECKTDFSKDIIGIMGGEKTSDSFNKLVWTFTVMLSVILAGFIAMLYL